MAYHKKGKKGLHTMKPKKPKKRMASAPRRAARKRNTSRMGY